jgi:multidrug efflux pump subunit AcrB
MKRLLVATVLLVLLAGGYYFRSLFFETAMDRTLYQYTLQSSDLDALYRFVPMIDAQMRQLPVLHNVSSNLEIKSPQASVNVDHRNAAPQGQLPAVTISFSLAPGVALGEAIAQIVDSERRLTLPATITSSVARAPTQPQSR